jgi:hypothetical protein
MEKFKEFCGQRQALSNVKQPCPALRRKNIEWPNGQALGSHLACHCANSMANNTVKENSVEMGTNLMEKCQGDPSNQIRLDQVNVLKRANTPGDLYSYEEHCVKNLYSRSSSSIIQRSKSRTLSRTKRKSV